MSLLTELGNLFCSVFYKYASPTGFRKKTQTMDKERVKRMDRQINRPFGTYYFSSLDPGVETPGYFQLSLTGHLECTTNVVERCTVHIADSARCTGGDGPAGRPY